MNLTHNNCEENSKHRTHSWTVKFSSFVMWGATCLWKLHFEIKTPLVHLNMNTSLSEGLWHIQDTLRRAQADSHEWRGQNCSFLKSRTFSLKDVVKHTAGLWLYWNITWLNISRKLCSIWATQYVNTAQIQTCWYEK